MPQLHLPPVKQLTLPNSKLLGITAGVLLLLYIVWWLLMFLSFDEVQVRDQTLAQLEKHFGAPVSYAGASEFSLTPFPSLTLKNLQVKNHPRALQRNSIQIPLAKIQVHPYSLFSSELIVSLESFGMKVELETFAGGDGHSWQHPDREKIQAQEKPAALINAITIHKAQFHYTYPEVEREIQLYVPTAKMKFPSVGEVEVAGKFFAIERYFEFGLTLSGENSTSQLLSTFVTDGTTTLKVEGNWDVENKKLEAKQHFETGDLASFLKTFTYKNYKPETGVAEQLKLPLSVDSTLNYSDSTLTMQDIAIVGTDIQGEGEIKTLLSDIPHIQSKLHFSQFNVTPFAERNVFSELLGEQIAPLTAQAKNAMSTGLPTTRKITLPKGVKIESILSADEARLHHINANDLQLGLSIINGSGRLEQLSAKLAGDTTLLVKGEVEGSLDGIALKGQLDIVGNHYEQFSNDLFGKGVGFPERLERFRGRANLFVNPAVMRLSEAVVRLEDVQLVGTLIRQRMEQKNVGQYHLFEGAFRLDNMNIDEWVDAQPAVEGDGLEAYHPLIRKLHYLTDFEHNTQYSLKVNLKDYTLDGESRPRAVFSLAMQRQNFMLSEVEAMHNGSYINGDIHFRFPKGKRPFIKASINADQVETSRFFNADYNQKRPFWQAEDGQWSRDEFDLSLLDEFDGTLELNFGRFQHRIWDVADLRVKASLQDSLLQVDSLEAGLWGGTFSLAGRLRAGKLPTIQGQYQLKNMVIERIHDITDFFDDLRGRVTLQGDVTTTGSNPYYLVQNAQGALSLAGRRLIIDGFNLSNMVRAANTVRTVADIEKLIAFADKGGETNIESISGSLNLNGGVLQTPGARIQSTMGNGTISGRVNLLDSSMNIALVMYLTALQQTSPPNIRLVFNGSLHEPSRTLDTQSLESFVAKQAAERLLDIR